MGRICLCLTLHPFWNPNHVPELRSSCDGDHAQQCLSVLLDCKPCGALLKPKPGDCCVFCSYGTVPCPPVQAGGGAPTCCAGDAAAVEIRPGVRRPDWSVVTSPAARDALLARDRSRPGPVEAWSTGLPQLQHAVWRATIASFARLGRPPKWGYATKTNLSERTVERMLFELEGYDLLAADKGRRSVGYAYPFTAEVTAHQVKVHSHELYALCAIDALGVGSDGRGDRIIVSTLRKGGIDRDGAGRHDIQECATEPCCRLVRSAYDCCAAVSCCPSVALFCSDEHLDEWLTIQAKQPIGRRLALADAFEIGRALFAPVLKPAAHDRVLHL